MLDWDNDGVLGPLDLTRSMQLVNCDSAFGRELQLLANHYINTHIKIQGKPKETETLTFGKYLLLLARSRAN